MRTSSDSRPPSRLSLPDSAAAIMGGMKDGTYLLLPFLAPPGMGGPANRTDLLAWPLSYA